MLSHGMGRQDFAAPNWTGFYIGVGVGGAFATHDLSAKDMLEQQNGGVVQVLNAERLFDVHNGRSGALRHGHPRL